MPSGVAVAQVAFQDQHPFIVYAPAQLGLVFDVDNSAVPRCGSFDRHPGPDVRGRARQADDRDRLIDAHLDLVGEVLPPVRRRFGILPSATIGI